MKGFLGWILEIKTGEDVDRPAIKPIKKYSYNNMKTFFELEKVRYISKSVRSEISDGHIFILENRARYRYFHRQSMLISWTEHEEGVRIAGLNLIYLTRLRPSIQATQ